MESNIKTYQDWVINLFVNVLNDKDLDQKFLLEHGYKYCLKDGAVCHYANTYWNSEENINMWQTNFRTKRYKGAEKALLMSKSACEIIKNIVDGQERMRDENNGYRLHWEHITPNGYVYGKLQSLKDTPKITYEAVQKCFRHHKIVILTKIESKLLDGKDEKFDENDSKLLKDWAKKLNGSFDADIESLKDENGHFGRCKNSGSGLGRIAHLWNNGVRFCKYDGNECDIRTIYDYLEESQFSYEKG